MSGQQDCRMYEAVFPEVDDVVMVQIESIAEMGAYVSLLEYNRIEGMILLSELSRRRIRSLTKLIKVGRQEPVMVLRVDKEKGYIDLSKRRVNTEDIEACEDQFLKSKLVHSIMRHVARMTNLDLEELYKSITWPLYKLYGHAFDAFRILVSDSDAVFKRLSEEKYGGNPVPMLDDNVKNHLIKIVQRRMTPQPMKIRADVELTCYAYDGLLHIQEAMRAAESASTPDCEVKMKLLAPPLYVLTTNTLEKVQGEEVLNKACQLALESIEKNKGRLVIREKARAITDRDDKILYDQMRALAQANREIDGDSDSEAATDFVGEVEGMGDHDIETSALEVPS